LIATGGAIGASLRYFSNIALKYFYPSFFLGTLFVNLVGSFLIGFLMSYLTNTNISENFIKYFLIIGLLGSYTTFSTFSFEAMELINSRRFLISFIYICFSVSSCLFFVFLGYNFNKI